MFHTHKKELCVEKLCWAQGREGADGSAQQRQGPHTKIDFNAILVEKASFMVLFFHAIDPW